MANPLDGLEEAAFFKVTYWNEKVDHRLYIYVCCPPYTKYEIVDILQHAESWFARQSVDVIIVGIEQLEHSGVLIIPADME